MLDLSKRGYPVTNSKAMPCVISLSLFNVPVHGSKINIKMNFLDYFMANDLLYTNTKFELLRIT